MVVPRFDYGLFHLLTTYCVFPGFHPGSHPASPLVVPRPHYRVFHESSTGFFPDWVGIIPQRYYGFFHHLTKGEFFTMCSSTAWAQDPPQLHFRLLHLLTWFHHRSLHVLAICCNLVWRRVITWLANRYFHDMPLWPWLFQMLLVHGLTKCCFPAQLPLVPWFDGRLFHGFTLSWSLKGPYKWVSSIC